MNCDTITEQMSEALDGRLDATQQAAFDAHLARCAVCREAYADLGYTVALLHELRQQSFRQYGMGEVQAGEFVLAGS